MSKISKTKFVEMVNIWVEVTRFNNELGSLLEDTDEVAELYEFDSWLSNTKDGEVSLMGLYDSIRKAENIASSLSDTAENKLIKGIIEIIKDNRANQFFDQELTDIDDSSLESIFELLHEDFDSIYCYDTPGQYKNFIKSFKESIEIFRNKTE